MVDGGQVYSLRDCLMTCVAEVLPATGPCAIESGDRMGTALLQMLVDGLRPDAGESIHAFISAPAGRGSPLRPGWEARQMRSHVSLGPPSDGDRSPLGVHGELLRMAAELGLPVFLCGELPPITTPDQPDPAGFVAALRQRAAELGIDVRFPFLQPALGATLMAMPFDQRWPTLLQVTTDWLPPECANPVACRDAEWSET